MQDHQIIPAVVLLRLFVAISPQAWQVVAQALDHLAKQFGIITVVVVFAWLQIPPTTAFTQILLIQDLQKVAAEQKINEAEAVEVSQQTVCGANGQADLVAQAEMI